MGSSRYIIWGWKFSRLFIGGLIGCVYEFIFVEETYLVILPGFVYWAAAL